MIKIEPREPAARPQYPPRDARAVRPTYIVEPVEESDILPETPASRPQQAQEPQQVQEPRDPEAHPHYPPRP